MAWKNSEETYGAAAKLLHWILFFIIAGMLTAGLIMVGMENTPDKFKLYGLHKSFGILVLSLAALRLAWRLYNHPPKLPAWMKSYERFAAHFTHWLLYALMFALPLTGWAMSSAAGFPVSVFGLFTLPDFVAPDKALLEVLRALHGWLAYAIMGLIALHAGAALLHHFYHKDNVLRRMLPMRPHAQDPDRIAR